MNDEYTIATTVDDLLQDDFFLKSTLNPTEETNFYWSTLLDERRLDVRVFAEAKKIILEADSLFHVSDSQVEMLWRQILIKNKKRARRRKILRTVSSASAVAAVFLLLFIGYHQFAGFDSKLISENQNQIMEPDYKSDNIQLITSSEGAIEITGREATIDYSASDSVTLNGKKLVDKKEQVAEQIVYNEIIVPYGKRTAIILSDNSKLWINAGSKVKYPVKFAEDKREIFVEGEVYAEVTKDPQRQFIFKTSKLDVRVLGTTLNVRAYKSQPEQQVVLVTGAVKVACENRDEKLLVPNQMYSYSDGISNIKNVNVSNYTSWISGYYTFEDENLDVILKSISQYYGVKINCPLPKKVLYSGNLELKDNVANVLSGLSYILSMEYKYENETYILTRK